MPAAWLHLPLGRDLRRVPLHLRLRPARASTCCATSRTPGGARWSSCATTWSGSTRPSCRPPAVWEASGHLANFTDPLVDCRNCHERWRADKIDGVCPNCGSTDFTEARAFNLMFKTHAGPVEDEGTVAYLRPETAQGMFTNFANVLDTTRKKPPFGIAQVGKSFRNEITPAELRLPHPRVRADGDGVLRRRPTEAPDVVRVLAGRALSVVPRPRHARPSCSGCAITTPTSSPTTRRGTADVEFLFPWGWDELEGIANRGDFDLQAHAKASGERLEYFDQADRRALHALCDRAGRRGHPGHDGLPAGRLRRGRGGRRGPHGAAASTGGWRRTRWRCSRCRRRRRSSRWPARCSALLQPHFMCDYDVTQSHRPPLPAPGRDRDAVVRHRRLRLAGGRGGHGARPRHAPSRCGSPSTGCWPSCGRADRRRDSPRLGRPAGHRCGMRTASGASTHQQADRTRPGLPDVGSTTVRVPPSMRSGRRRPPG